MWNLLPPQMKRHRGLTNCGTHILGATPSKSQQWEHFWKLRAAIRKPHLTRTVALLITGPFNLPALLTQRLQLPCACRPPVS